MLVEPSGFKVCKVKLIMATLGPRESSALISKSSKHVFINEQAIQNLSNNLLGRMRADQEYIHFKGWKSHALNPSIADDAAIDWIFLVDTLNYSFWSVDSSRKYIIKYNNTKYTGYWSLCAAVNRALDENIPITSAEYCRDFTIEQARHVFRSDSTTEIPLLDERVRMMKEVGKILVEKFDGKFSNCIKKAENNGQKLMKLVVDNFPCFRDEGEYKGQKVSFYKRAQILVADLWACFEGQGAGRFGDINSITMFADYRIPQALAYFGVLSYSEELMKLLKEEHMFQNGDEMEMEIRGGSIWAVEKLAKCINELLAEEESKNMRNIQINAVNLDHFLWDYRSLHNAETEHIPYHKVRCIYY